MILRLDTVIGKNHKYSTWYWCLLTFLSVMEKRS